MAQDSAAPSATDRSPRLPLVLLSHRGPVSFDRDPSDPGSPRTASRGAGGLVTALSGLAEHLADHVWVCAASSDEDVVVTREAAGRPVLVSTTPGPHLVEDAGGEPALRIRMVDVDPDRHAGFYGVISNPLLWFIQHGLYGRGLSPVLTQAEHDAFENGYVAVNRQFADAVADEVERRGGRAMVMLQDYHFYLVAERVRERCPDVLLSHFIHIPWPGPEEWRVLPPHMRERLLAGLLGNDVVGFHTRRFARNFVLCAYELLGLAIDLEALTVQVGERTVHVRYYPISVDPKALDEVAATPEVADYAAGLRDAFDLEDGGRLVVRVDRTDPSKNVVRGFLAFGTMLDDHPELVGKVSFLALLQPSRTDVPEYADYIARVGAIVAEVNARHTADGRQPIDMRMVEDFPLAVAAYQVCDVLMVNALADGMNLVAKEVAVVNTRGGVLALSENTGAHEELGDFAVTLYPFDVQQMADALYAALALPLDERRKRLGEAADQVRAHDVGRWLSDQIEELNRLAG